MSGSTARPSAPAPADTPSLLHRFRKLTATSVRSLAFWGAVCMPVASLAALHQGIAARRPALFFALLVANVVCILIGHDYTPGQ